MSAPQRQHFLARTQGYRIWILVNWDKKLMRKPSSQPARFSLPRYGAFARLQPGQIQRQLPQQHQVLRAMSLPVPRLVLVASHIQYPVQPVFNPSMTPHSVVEPFLRAGFAQQVVAALFTFGPVMPPDGGHFAHDTIFDQSQARPMMRFL